MTCPFPHCVKEEFHDGKRETRRFTRTIESGKLMFAVVGACGYAGCLASMHFVLATLSMCLMGITWYGLYSITEIEYLDREVVAAKWRPAKGTLIATAAKLPTDRAVD